MPNPRPLDGVVVLDLSLNLPGPYTTRLLQDLGAQVTKVEPPRGDPARGMPLYDMLNAGKRIVTLDLATEAGRAELHGLLPGADVLVEGFRPGVADKLGFGPQTARDLNPRLVYCSISAFGQDGPLRDLPGHDLNLQALSGVCHVGRDGWGRPHGLALPVADLSAASTAALRIVAALGRGEARGEHIDVALLDTTQEWAALWGRGVDLTAAPGVPAWARRLAAGWIGRRTVYALPHYGCFRCWGGDWLAVGIVDEGHFWRGLCEELGLHWLSRIDLPTRALTGPLLRVPLAVRFATRPRQAWLERLEARGIPVTPVLDPSRAGDHPQVVRRAARADGPAGRDRTP